MQSGPKTDNLAKKGGAVIAVVHTEGRRDRRTIKQRDNT